MNKHQTIASLIFAVLVIVIVSMSGIVNTAAFAAAPKTPRATRDLTQNPRPTKTETKRPTRDLTQNPRKTKTPEATAAPTETLEPTGAAENPAAALPDAITSRLLILNTDRGGMARVTVNLFDLNGSVAFSDTFKIQENGAKIVNVPKSLGDDFKGSARISANRHVQALVLDQSADKKASDAYEVTNVQTGTVTLPYVRYDAASADSIASTHSTNALIAIQNTSAVSADATFTAFDTTGAQTLSHPVTIPARSSVYLNTTDLFGGTSFLGSARITANENIAAAELTTFQQDTASMRALNGRDEDKRLVVPNVERKRRKDGTVMAWNEMYIRNNGSAPTDIKIDYHSANGKLIGTVTRANVPAGGLAVLDASTAEFQFLGGKFIGWADVTSTNDTPIVATTLVVRSLGKQVIAMDGEPRGGIAARAICGAVRLTDGMSSAVTLVNTRPKKSIKIRVRFYNQDDGALVKEFHGQLKPNGQAQITSKNGLPANFQGIAIVDIDPNHTSRAVVASVLTQTLKGKKVQSTSGYMCN